MLLKINVKGDIYHSNRDDSLLRVAGIVQVIKDSEWSFPIHSHDDILDLVLITRGEGTLLFNNAKFKTQKGDLIVFNQDVLHGEYTNPTNPLETIVVNLAGVKIGDLPDNHAIPEDLLPILKTGEYFNLLYNLFSFVKDQCIKQEQGFEMLCKDSAKLILSLVQQLTEKHKQKSDEELSFPIMMKIIEYLDVNYNKNMRLKELETIFHFSQYYLAHKFKEETGFTINQYITNRRIGEAEKLLIYTDKSITEIAQAVGYDNLSHFYTIFKKHTGLSPSNLKEKYNR